MYNLNLLFLSQAILDKATGHTKSLLQKSEEKARALEKVSVSSGGSNKSLVCQHSNCCFPFCQRQKVAQLHAERNDDIKAVAF